MRLLNLNGYLSTFNASDAKVGFIDVPKSIQSILIYSEGTGIFTTEFEFIHFDDDGYDEAQKTAMDALKSHPWTIAKNKVANENTQLMPPVHEQIKLALEPKG